MPWEEWDDVVAAACGARGDYQLEGRPRGTGGQAIVTAGVHRATEAPIAFKRLRPGLIAQPDARRRLAREIDAGLQIAHRNAVPVLDSSLEEGWFVMPLADETLEDRQTQLAADDDALVRLLRRVGNALHVAHEATWVHRDIKPANILRFTREGKYRWAISDWGLSRRPAGTTTSPGLTRTGYAYGTEGFAPPELSLNAHHASAAADVYSLGQVIGWVRTGQTPQANIPLLPPSGPWRTVVAEATRRNPQDRPQTIAEFLDLVETELDPLPEPPTARAQQLLDQAEGGSAESAVALLRMGTADPGSFVLFSEFVANLGAAAVRAAAKQHPELMIEVMDALGSVGADERFIPFHVVARVENFALRTLSAAGALGDETVATAALTAFCRWDDDWDRWDPQKRLAAVLRELRDGVATAAARVLRRHPQSAVRLRHLADDTRVDATIRGVLSHATDH